MKFSLALSVFGFLLLQKFLNFDFIFARSFLGRTQICQRLFLFFVLPREGLLILSLYVVLFTGSSQCFQILLFATFLGQLLQQDWSRCWCRWENLDRSQYRFQPIKFVNLVVPSACETEPCIII